MNSGRNGNGKSEVTLSMFPEDVQSRVMQWYGTGDDGRRGVAQTAISICEWIATLDPDEMREMFGRMVGRMDVYDMVGDGTGRSGRTVRDWADRERAVGPIVARYPFSMDTWDEIIPAARQIMRKNGIDRDNEAELLRICDTLAAKLMESSQDYGGLIIPPRAVFKHARTSPTPGEQFEDAVQAMRRARDRMDRAIKEGHRVPDNVLQLAATAGAAIGDLANAVAALSRDDVPGASMDARVAQQPEPTQEAQS